MFKARFARNIRAQVSSKTSTALLLTTIVIAIISYVAQQHVITVTIILAAALIGLRDLADYLTNQGGTPPSSS